MDEAQDEFVRPEQMIEFGGEEVKNWKFATCTSIFAQLIVYFGLKKRVAVLVKDFGDARAIGLPPLMYPGRMLKQQIVHLHVHTEIAETKNENQARRPFRV